MFAFDGERMSDVEEARLGAADVGDVEGDLKSSTSTPPRHLLAWR